MLRLRAVTVFILLVAGTVRGADLKVRVELRDRAGKPVPNAYVGIVPAHSPWRHPLREELGKSSIEWRVAPGAYRVVAGAVGFKTVWGNVFELDADRHVPILLEPLIALRGAVSDSSGQPVRNARVGLLGQFYEHDFLLSPQAEALLRPNSLVATDDDGRFALPVPADGRVIVVIEADGFAPVVRNNIQPAATPDLGAIALRRGATLTVTWRGEDGGSLDRLQLQPVHVDLPAELPPGRAAAIWTRPRIGEQQQWMSLYPGEYDVVLRASTLSDGEPSPVVVTRVHLHPAEDAKVRVQLPSPPSRSATSGKGTTVFIGGANLAEWQNAAVTGWADDRPQSLGARIHGVAGGVRIDVDESCVAGMTILASTKESLAAGAIRNCDVPIELRAHPSARVRAMLAPPVGSRIPAAATIRYPACADGPEHRAAIVNGRLDFDAAADCGEAIVSIGRFAALRVGPPELAAGETADLGKISLQVGGAVSVRVLDGDNAPAAGAVVQACRLSEVQQIRGEFSIASLRPVARATVDAAGWARLFGLPDDEIVLAVVRGDERVPALAGPFRVAARQEQILEDVVLPGTGDLDVSVTVEEELQGAIQVSGLSLQMTDPLWPRDAHLSSRYDRPATRIPALPAGEWSIAPSVAMEGIGSIAAPPTKVVIVPGAVNPVTVPSGFRAYRGRLTKSGEGVAGHLMLRPSGNTAGVLSAATADEDGNFVVPLTAPGEYEVRFRDATGRTMELASRAQFTNPAERAEVRLGAGRITGIVVDEKGQPAEGATVGAERSRDLEDGRAEAYVVTKADGTFAIDGLEPGFWSISASRGARQSPGRSVDLAAEPPMLTLVLSEQADTSVIVTTAAGHPVAGALVAVTPVGAPGGVLLHPVAARTNASGVAKLRGLDRSSAPAWNVNVRTRDAAVVSAKRAPADEIRIVFPPATGTLVLRREDGEASDTGRYARLIAPDGSSFAPLWAGSPAADGTLAPRMPAGIWRLAEATTAAGAYAIEAGLSGTFEILGAATVVPGGISEIVIPSHSPFGRTTSAATARKERGSSTGSSTPMRSAAWPRRRAPASAATSCSTKTSAPNP